jgi:hypothetical protein
MTKKQGKNRGIESLLGYLDEQINGYYQKTGNYPIKLIISKETRDKIFAELNLEPTLDNCWFNKKDNYRNIKIEISNIEQIKLE